MPKDSREVKPVFTHKDKVAPGLVAIILGLLFIFNMILGAPY